VQVQRRATVAVELVRDELIERDALGEQRARVELLRGEAMAGTLDVIAARDRIEAEAARHGVDAARDQHLADVTREWLERGAGETRGRERAVRRRREEPIHLDAVAARERDEASRRDAGATGTRATRQQSIVAHTSVRSGIPPGTPVVDQSTRRSAGIGSAASAVLDPSSAMSPTYAIRIICMG